MLCAGSFALAAACSADRRTNEDASPAASSPRDEAAIDLATFIERSRHRFVASQDGFVADHATHVTSVARDGALRVRPVASRRASAPIELTTLTAVKGVARLDVDGSVVVSRGDIVERVRDVTSGVEQSWELATRPPGEQDLEIHVAVRGARHVATTESGEHFVPDAGGPGIRYGKATWIDAEGARSDVPAIWSSGELVLRVDRNRLRASSFPAVLDPVIGPEVAVDVPVADPGASYLGRTSVFPGANGASLLLGRNVALRVDAAGGALGTRFTLPVDYASVAYDPVDDQWLATIEGGLVRIAGNGQILDATPIVIDRYGYDTEAAFDGTRYLVTYFEPDTNGVHGVLVTPGTGATALTSPAILSTGSVFTPTVGCDGVGTCLVAWADDGIRAVRVSKTGARLDAQPFVVGDSDAPSFAYGPSIAYAAGRFLVVWRNSASAIRAARVTAAGVVEDAAPLAVGTGLAGGTYPKVVSTGTAFTVSYRTASNVSARRVATNGAFLDAGPVALPSGACGTASWSSTQHVVPICTGSTLGIARLGADLGVLGTSGALMPTPAIGQTAYGAASNGSNHLVLWTDARSGGVRLYGVRVGSAGAPIESAPHDYAAVGTYGGATVASNGQDYLAVVRAASGDFAQRVSGATGDPVGAPVPLDRAGSVAWDGQSYVVATTSQLNGRSHVFGTRISPAGAVLDATPFVVTSAQGGQYSATIASDGATGSLVAYQDSRVDPLVDYVYATRIDRQGKSLDSADIAVGIGGGHKESPVVAWDGARYVVAWTETVAWDDWTIAAARVSPSGQVLSPGAIPVARDRPNARSTSIGSMGDGSTLIAWADDRFGTYRVHGSFLRGSNGEVLDTPPRLLVPEPGATTSWDPVISAQGPHKALLVYARHTPEELAPRVRARVIDSGTTLGGACTSAADCASRFCADGVCCEAACDGVCRACDASGKCGLVVSAPDPGTCDGERSCNASGECRRKNGKPCEGAADCFSGICAAGICCDKPCDSACATCAAVPGTCTARGAAELGTPSCSPLRCDGATLTCPTACTNDESCADGFLCDVSNGSCVSGAVCRKRDVLFKQDGTTSSCAPYACRAGACVERCSSVEDCAFPSACNELGQCVMESSDGAVGGCSVIPAPDSPAGLSELACTALLAAGLTRRQRKRRTR